MSRYRKGRRRAALYGITSRMCWGGSVFRRICEVVPGAEGCRGNDRKSSCRLGSRIRQGSVLIPPEAGPDPEKMLSEAAVSWNGKEYWRNTYMKAVLCMGVDRENTMTGGEEPGQRGQADGIFLAAWDTARNGLKILMIPGDAMTYLTPVSWDGTVRDEEYDHITLAFSYGDGVCEKL